MIEKDFGVKLTIFEHKITGDKIKTLVKAAKDTKTIIVNKRGGQNDKAGNDES
jgi:hypothetical protein